MVSFGPNNNQKPYQPPGQPPNQQAPTANPSAPQKDLGPQKEPTKAPLPLLAQSSSQLPQNPATIKPSAPSSPEGASILRGVSTVAAAVVTELAVSMLKQAANGVNPLLGTLPSSGASSVVVTTFPFFVLTGNTLSLSPTESALFLRNLLGLPQELRDALLLLLSQSEASALKDLEPLLDQSPAPKISLDLLQALLLKSNLKASNRLIQLMRSNPKDPEVVDKLLKGMVLLTEKLSPESPTRHQEAIKTLILAYLPWLPLVHPQDIDVRFSDEEDAEAGQKQKTASDEESIQYTLFVYLTTVYWGNLKLSLAERSAQEIIIRVDYMDRAKAILPQVEAAAIQEAPRCHLPKLTFLWNEVGGARPPVSEIEAESRGEPSAVQNEHSVLTAPKSDKALSFVPQQGISILVVQAASVVSRLIFERDTRAVLDASREKLLEE